MLDDAPPVFYPDRYDEHGKWMDGWETRRRRGGGNDCCILQLGAKGIISGFDLNTRFFTGNHPPRAKIEGALTDTEPDDSTEWVELIGESDLAPDSPNLFQVTDDRPFNYIRLNIYPDGGIARFCVWGNLVWEWKRHDPQGHHELSAVINGGRLFDYNDVHYGDPWVILTPGRGTNIGDGWETRRRREPGNDWIVVALGAAGDVKRIEVDTAHFKDNYPDKCMLQAVRLNGVTDAEAVADSVNWTELMPEQKLQMDHVLTFDGNAITGVGSVTHVRLNIYPDGGVRRFRVFGQLAQER